MRILHTADWHMGQTLAGYSREAEHRAFLDHLGTLIVAHEADALLIAGDVFDGINPSSDAQRLLYAALARFVRLRPGLTVVMIAGNHDPAARLEAPEAVLRELGVHVVGRVHAEIERHVIALTDTGGAVHAHVLAIPFLRAADLPGLTLGAAGAPEPGAESAVVAATRALHSDLTRAALTHIAMNRIAKTRTEPVHAAPSANDTTQTDLAQTAALTQSAASARTDFALTAQLQSLPLIAMGHLTCAGGLPSEGAERRILIGGEHAVPPDIYPAEFAYVALGHLHKPQSLDGGRVRYAGSPFPLSASEIPYDHGVTLIDIQGQCLTHRHIPLPRPVPCLRLPATGAAALPDIAALLEGLALNPATPPDLRPFVHLTLTADRPASTLRAEAEALLDRYPVRVASLVIERKVTALPDAPPPSLAQTSPEALFVQAFRQTHQIEPTSAHLSAFADAVGQV